jgi:hypothetical protein
MTLILMMKNDELDFNYGKMKFNSLRGSAVKLFFIFQSKENT